MIDSAQDKDSKSDGTAAPRSLPDPQHCRAELLGGSDHLALCRMTAPSSCAYAFSYGNQYFCRHADRQAFVARFLGERGAAPARKRLERVLFVEDEEDIQRIVKVSLERFGGMAVDICGDSRIALQKTRELAPDLILLDYLMPGLDGVALFRRLQADPQLARIPVVFLTASAVSHKAEELRALGAAGVLFKPFDVRQLPEKLRKIWNALGG